MRLMKLSSELGFKNKRKMDKFAVYVYGIDVEMFRIKFLALLLFFHSLFDVIVCILLACKCCALNHLKFVKLLVLLLFKCEFVEISKQYNCRTQQIAYVFALDIQSVHYACQQRHTCSVLVQMQNFSSVIPKRQIEIE